MTSFIVFSLCFSGCLDLGHGPDPSPPSSNPDPDNATDWTLDALFFFDTFHRDVLPEPLLVSSPDSPYLLAYGTETSGVQNNYFGILDPVSRNWSYEQATDATWALGTSTQWGAWDGSRAHALAMVIPSTGGLPEAAGRTVYGVWDGEWKIEMPERWDGLRPMGLAAAQGEVAVLTNHLVSGWMIWELDGDNWSGTPIPGWDKISFASIGSSPAGWIVAGYDTAGRVVVVEGRDGLFLEKWATLPYPPGGLAVVSVSHSREALPLISWLQGSLVDESTTSSLAAIDGSTRTSIGSSQWPIHTAGTAEEGWALMTDNSLDRLRIYAKNAEWQECDTTFMDQFERIDSPVIWHTGEQAYLAFRADADFGISGIKVDQLCLA